MTDLGGIKETMKCRVDENKAYYRHLTFVQGTVVGHLLGG